MRKAVRRPPASEPRVVVDDRGRRSHPHGAVTPATGWEPPAHLCLVDPPPWDWPPTPQYDWNGFASGAGDEP